MSFLRMRACPVVLEIIQDLCAAYSADTRPPQAHLIRMLRHQGQIQGGVQGTTPPPGSRTGPSPPPPRGSALPHVLNPQNDGILPFDFRVIALAVFTSRLHTAARMFYSRRRSCHI